jgi:hypothetical protein
LTNAQAYRAKARAFKELAGRVTDPITMKYLFALAAELDARATAIDGKLINGHE